MKINKELLRGSTVILILKSLERRPMYGYEMIREIEDESGEVFRLNQGTLYPLLHTLESKGFVSSYWNSEGARPRKYYQVTDRGLGELQKKKKEWTVFRSAVDRVLGEAIVCH